MSRNGGADKDFFHMSLQLSFLEPILIFFNQASTPLNMVYPSVWCDWKPLPTPQFPSRHWRAVFLSHG